MKEIVGYKVYCDEPEFSVSNIVKIPVEKDEIRNLAVIEKSYETCITLSETRVALSSVSTSLCFRYKLLTLLFIL